MNKWEHVEDYKVNDGRTTVGLYRCNGLELREYPEGAGYLKFQMFTEQKFAHGTTRLKCLEELLKVSKELRDELLEKINLLNEMIEAERKTEEQ